MIVSYYFSSSSGDIPVDDATLGRPFMVRPLEAHPFITLGDFFSAVREFIFHDTGRSLTHALSRLWGEPFAFDDIKDIIIRYEKYGTLYHISSTEILAHGHKAKFAVNAAMYDAAKTTLQHEFNLLMELGRQRKPSFLPEAHYRESIKILKGQGSETLLMTLSEWFDGYHEWHFSQDEKGEERIIIWDMAGGWRFASVSESYEIIRQASKILALYYNTKSCQMIFPWHHGAGDFVVKTDKEIVDVKLITVRGHESVITLLRQKAASPLEALLQFFLNTTIKMRLDKKEGMGGPYWAKASVLNAVMAGFVEALKMKELEDDAMPVKSTDFINLLKSLSKNKIKTLLYSHLDAYRIHDPSDTAFIQNFLDDHSAELYPVINAFS